MDAGLADAGLAEAGLAEAGLAEAGLADAGLAEAGLAEAGGTPAVPGRTGPRLSGGLPANLGGISIIALLINTATGFRSEA